MRALAVVVLVLAWGATAARAQGFDYFVLAISWTPAWCERDGDARDAPTCAPGAGVGWGVHGLWPQHDDGTWPEFCATPERNPSRAQTAEQADLFGSGGSAWHQWNKHGRCSGLSAAAYYALTRDAAGALDLPPLEAPGRLAPGALRAAILDRNPDFAAGSVVITCSSGMLGEVRVCLAPDLLPRACDAGLAARGCRAASIRIPAPR